MIWFRSPARAALVLGGAVLAVLLVVATAVTAPGPQARPALSAAQSPSSADPASDGAASDGAASDGAASDGAVAGAGVEGAAVAVGEPETPVVPALPPGLTAEDVAAGLLSADVPQVGSGAFTVVPGAVPAPGPGRVRTVRVEVEDGVPVDGGVFAAFVLDTLNDPRSWGHGGAMSFARTDGDAEIVVVLAAPDTSARLCAPLVTRGRLSCRVGERAVLTHYRWVLAHPDYGADRTGYRRYLVNHEVGHALGEGHVDCPGPGLPAPVMQQQSKGLDGCAPNSWPFP